MKILAAMFAAATTLAAAAVTAPHAEACGGYGAVLQERAEGGTPQLARKDGKPVLRLSYPTFALRGDQLYTATFTVVDDDNLRRLEQQLVRGQGRVLSVSLREVSPDRWQVIGFGTRTKHG